ncbi:SH3 domain-containing protein [Antarctobacter heliothermus]|uniref:von Hippel-Lindau disease tumour suppressor protein n=1 Tax=Antarctobacter heliothermus TaxID=74033 RepID=A0A239FX80_9RHOB|nr:SH3 domain-containing protein [Antarctobacter heliothermus]SNS61098.1 von Hippel-Lindau disease tumour suppressor protein [Antarctobacter heliothermus]
MKTQIASIALALTAALTASNASALSISLDPYYSEFALTSHHADSSCHLWGKASSRHSQDQLTFNFVNHTSTYRVISWLDFHGDVKEYATLAPGQSVEIQTYEGHPWLIQDGRGDCLEVIENGAKLSYATTPKTQTYPGTPDDYAETYKVSGTWAYGGHLNMRTGPGKSYGRIAVLPEGYPVEVVKKSHGWGKIQLKNGHSGWVSMKFLAAM